MHYNRIHEWNKQRGLLDKPFNTNIEIKNILEELNELKVQIDSKEARNNAEIQLEDIKSDTDFLEPSTPIQKVDALCDIIIYATGALIKLGYDPEEVMEETLKEIESRKGTIIDGKFEKDLSLKDEWYKADYRERI